VCVVVMSVGIVRLSKNISKHFFFFLKGNFLFQGVVLFYNYKIIIIQGQRTKID